MKKLLAVMLIIISLLTFTPKRSDAQIVESLFIQSINLQRTTRGLNELSINPEMTDLAVQWSKTLAEQKSLSHSDLVTGVTQNWKKLGENVGMGGSATSIITAFINSPNHLNTMVDPAFESVGIGITTQNNTLYVVQKFIQLSDVIVAKPIPTTTVVVVPPTTTVTLPPTTTLSPTTTIPITEEPTISEAPKVASAVDSGSLMKRWRQIILKIIRMIWPLK